jgi:D-glycero-D-manno-heptose 1,7-bisphosphate phosphatase
VRLVLVDRDGTLVDGSPRGRRYLERPEDVILLPRVRQAVARLNDEGISVAVVTNQRGIATGCLSTEDCDAVHARIAELLSPARIDDWFVCPHDVGACSCRKPAPGLVLAALARFQVAASQAVIVGNSESDVQAGARGGVRGVGVGPDPPAEGSQALDWVPTLADAVDAILGGRV